MALGDKCSGGEPVELFTTITYLGKIVGKASEGGKDKHISMESRQAPYSLFLIPHPPMRALILAVMAPHLPSGRVRIVLHTRGKKVESIGNLEGSSQQQAALNCRPRRFTRP